MQSAGARPGRGPLAPLLTKYQYLQAKDMCTAYCSCLFAMIYCRHTYAIRPVGDAQVVCEDPCTRHFKPNSLYTNSITCPVALIIVCRTFEIGNLCRSVALRRPHHHPKSIRLRHLSKLGPWWCTFPCCNYVAHCSALSTVFFVWNRGLGNRTQQVHAHDSHCSAINQNSIYIFFYVLLPSYQN